MMKGAADKPVQMEIMPGQSSAKHGLRARMGQNQAMADFDKLLARQSAHRDLPSEKTDESLPDGSAVAQLLSSPEAVLLAIANQGELAARFVSAEAFSATASANIADSEPDRRLQRAETEIVSPMTDGEVPSGDRAAAKSKASFNASLPLPVERSEGEPADDHAANLSDGTRSKDHKGALAALERQDPLTVEDAAAAEMPEKSQTGNPQVSLIRVAGQETHLAPSPVVLVDGYKTGPTTMTADLGAADPVRSQAAPPPIPLLHHGGPLRVLRVQLGSNELGLINATMALKENVLDLRIGAMRDDAVASLRENAGKLSDALQSLGYSVDGVTVQKLHQPDAAQQTGYGQPSQHGTAGQDGSGQGQRDLSGSQAGAEGSARQSRQTFNDDRSAEHDGNDQAKGSTVARNGHGVFL